MNNHTGYTDISAQALKVQEKYDLTRVQTLLYDHICRGDYYLYNGDGHQYYGNIKYGYNCDKKWVRKQLSVLIEDGLVFLNCERMWKNRKKTVYYFYNPSYDFFDLINTQDFVYKESLCFIKKHLNLPDGFDKKNVVYGDVEFIYNLNTKNYTFKYKGEESIYQWQYSKIGAIRSCYDFALQYSTFAFMVCDLHNFIIRDLNNSKI